MSVVAVLNAFSPGAEESPREWAVAESHHLDVVDNWEALSRPMARRDLDADDGDWDEDDDWDEDEEEEEDEEDDDDDW